MNKLGTDVTGVKSDLITKNNLNMARGFGTDRQRRHGDGDRRTRRLGDRDYYEFTIDKRNQRKKIGDMMGKNFAGECEKEPLHRHDVRGRFTLRKKNRSANEPVYFFTHGSH